jgi:hypothetical protein
MVRIQGLIYFCTESLFSIRIMVAMDIFLLNTADWGRKEKIFFLNNSQLGLFALHSRIIID